MRYSKTLSILAVVLFSALPSLAAAAPTNGTITFSGGNYSVFNQTQANGARGSGGSRMRAGQYPNGTTTIQLTNGGHFNTASSTWTAFGSTVWVGNWGCTAPSSVEADCNYDASAHTGSLTDIAHYAGGHPGTTTVPVAGYYYQLYYDTLDAPTGVYYEFYWDGIGTPIQEGAAPPSQTTIISVAPINNTTVSSSSPVVLGGYVYVLPDDFSDGMYLEMKYARYSDYQAAVASPELLYTTYTFPITASGFSTFSTTTPSTLRGGQYTMTSTIKSASMLNGVLNFFGFGQFANFGTKTSTTTQFVVGELSGYDKLVASTTQAIADYMASSTISFASCTSWTSFDLPNCLNLLFVPQAAPIAAALDNFKNEFLSYAPWGYLTRTVAILSNTASSSLPTFSVTFPLGSAADLDTMTFDMQDMIAGGGTLLNSIPARGMSLNIQDILQPLVRLFIALTLVVIIVRDLSHGHGGGKHNFHASAARKKGHV